MGISNYHKYRVCNVLRFIFLKKECERTLFAGYRIIPEHQLIVEVLEGELTLDSLLHFRKEQMSDPLFDINYSYITDERFCVIDSIITEVDKYVSFMEKSLSQSDKIRKVASLVRTQNQMAYINAYKDRHTKKLQDLRLFTNLKTALGWLEKENICAEVSIYLSYVRKNLNTYV